jgi:hypothetical protein
VSPLSSQEIGDAVQRIAGTSATWGLLTNEDDYYYSLLSKKAVLPAIKVTAGGDYYYLDPISGALVNRADAGERAYRWWHNALHRWDFSRPLRSTFGRSVIMLPLLLGATLLCVIGFILAVHRVCKSRNHVDFRR